MAFVLRCCRIRVPFFTLLYAGICLSALLCLLVFWSPPSFLSSAPQQKIGALDAPLVDYSLLGTGPLYLKSTGDSSLAQSLKEELLIIAKNTRPDVRGDSEEILLRLKTSKKEKRILNGTPVFLSFFTEENGRVHIVDFSEEPSSVRVTANVLDKEKALIEVCLDADTKQFVSQLAGALGARVDSLLQKTEEVAIQDLKRAKWWGHDLFLQNYGGKEYLKLANKHKLEIGDPAHICFVGESDFLVWEEGVWKNVGDAVEALNGRVIARIKSIQQRKMEMEVWDETGFYGVCFPLEMQTSARLSNRTDQLPASLRMRTATQVTCTLGGKKRFILRQGDWLLKTAAGWRNLKKNSEIDAYVRQELRGELFIFDKLEKEKNKAVLKGHIFDEMRTQMQPVHIPIVMEKGK